MKKLLLLLFIPLLFTACSDEDDKGYPEWKGDIAGFNPLAGLWKHQNKDSGWYFTDDKRAFIVTFNPDQSYTMKPSDKYEINNEALKFDAGSIKRYKIEDEKLTIYPNLNNNHDEWILMKIE